VVSSSVIMHDVSVPARNTRRLVNRRKSGRWSICQPSYARRCFSSRFFRSNACFHDSINGS
jgi:hypothetical protein